MLNNKDHLVHKSIAGSALEILIKISPKGDRLIVSKTNLLRGLWVKQNPFEFGAPNMMGLKCWKGFVNENAGC